MVFCEADDLNDNEYIFGLYVIGFLNTAMKMLKIPVENWVKLVGEFKLADMIVEQFDYFREMQPEDYSLFLLNFFKSHGVDIDEYR